MHARRGRGRAARFPAAGARTSMAPASSLASALAGPACQRNRGDAGWAASAAAGVTGLGPFGFFFVLKLFYELFNTFHILNF